MTRACAPSASASEETSCASSPTAAASRVPWAMAVEARCDGVDTSVCVHVPLSARGPSLQTAHGLTVLAGLLTTRPLGQGQADMPYSTCTCKQLLRL